MIRKSHTCANPSCFRRYSILLVLLWSAVIAGSMVWNYHQERAGARQTARQEAVADFQKDLIYRQWNAGHGGVYVPVSPQTQPNPHLQVSERDIETPSGRRLTFMNPAFMTRQAHELGLKKFGARGHITSLKPIRPENLPDPWEREALLSFEQGHMEAVSIATFEDGQYLRFMRPLTTAERCLKCHAEQGYKAGDIRGGISVSIPMTEHLDLAFQHIRMLAVGHSLIWLLGVIGIVLGIRRFGKYESGLLESNNRLETVSNAIQSGVLVIDRDSHTIIEANSAACRLIGSPREEIVGQTCHQFICPAQNGACPITDLGQTVDNAERKLIRADGTHAYILKTVVSSFIDDQPCLIETFVDITDRKQMELKMEALLEDREKQNLKLQTRGEALKASENKFRNIFESFQDLYFRVDDQGNIELISPSVKAMAGYEVDELIGRSVLDVFVNPDERGEFMEDLLANGKTTNYELKLTKKNGETAIVSINAQLADNGSGNGGAVEGVIRDVTERKQQEEQLRSLNEALEKAIEHANTTALEAEMSNIAKGEFLANMSHEIRTPMNAVIGLTYLALKTQLTSKQKDYLTKIQASAKFLLNIIDDILDFSKIEAGKLDLELVDFNLDDTLSNLSTIVGIKAQEKDLELIFAVDRAVPIQLVGDSLRLEQVLLNLLNNAVKFTERGQIVISVGLLEEQDNACVLKFAVQDTGIGLTERQKSGLFAAFTQADSSITRKYGGTGLGLTISKSLVNLMGGDIGVESERGQGSTFFFTLRFKTRSDDSRKYRLPSADLLEAPVLVVCDKTASRQAIQNLLEYFRCRVACADSAQEAMRQLQKAQQTAEVPFKLMFMLWKLADSDGIELALSIKQMPEHHDTPITIIAPHGRRDIQRRVTAAGLNATLFKPVLMSTLLEAIKEACGYTSKQAAGFQEEKVQSEGMRQIQGARILLVEDNEINQQVAREILEGTGFFVDIAPNGNEGVAKIKASEFDVVLMDIQMPVMDGYMAAKAIRNLKSEKKNIPVIAMTAGVTAGDRAKAAESGMNDHVAKPIVPEQLFATLAKWVAPGERELPDSFTTDTKETAADESALFLSDFPGISVSSGLARVRGNKALYKKLLTKFHDNYANVIDDIQSAIEAGDRELAQRIAHTLKSASGNLGADQLFQTAGELETIIINKEEADKLDPLMKDLAISLITVLDSIQQLNLNDEPESSNDQPLADPSTPIDLDRVKPLVVELAGLIEDDIAEALECVMSLGKSLGASHAGKILKEIKDSLDKYDTDMAAERLEQLADHLHISL